MGTSVELDLPSSIKDTDRLINEKDYISAVRNINKYLKLWPLEEDFYIAKAFCEIKLCRYHNCLATIASYHGQLYKPKHQDSLETIIVAKDHLVDGFCKWLHFEQCYALYKLGKYNLALRALKACKANSPAIALQKEINLQNNSFDGDSIDNPLEIASHLSLNQQIKYLHLLAQIFVKIEKYDQALVVYNNLSSRTKEPDILTNNILVTNLMKYSYCYGEDDKYKLIETILQKFLDYQKINSFELLFNASLVESFGGNIDNSINYLDMAEEFANNGNEFSNDFSGEIVDFKAHRSYLKMYSKNIEAEAFYKIFIDHIKTNPEITTALLYTAVNILIHTKNEDTKRDMMKYIISSISKGIGHLNLSKYEFETLYRNILTSMLHLGMISEFQQLLCGIKAKCPEHNFLTLFFASLYYAQNKLQKCEQVLARTNDDSGDNQMNILALMTLNYLQKKLNKVISIYNSSFAKLSGDYLHKSVLIALKSIKSISDTDNNHETCIDDMEKVVNSYKKICNEQSLVLNGTNLLLISMIYIKYNMYEKAGDIYKQILFGNNVYEKHISEQAACGLAFVESFTKDYKLWTFDFDDDKRSSLLTKFQHNIYDKIKFIDGEDLERDGVTYIHSNKLSTNEVAVKTKKNKNRKRSRRGKMAQNILDIGPPDPERWLPKHERSGFKKSKKKKKDDFVAKSTQGSTAAPASSKFTTANISTAPKLQKRKKKR